METSQDSLFEQAMARYQAGAAAEEVLPDFARIVEAAPRQSAGWTCLAWRCWKPNPRACVTTSRWSSR